MKSAKHKSCIYDKKNSFAHNIDFHLTQKNIILFFILVSTHKKLFKKIMYVILYFFSICNADIVATKKHLASYTTFYLQEV